jgi:hypothetical protein
VRQQKRTGTRQAENGLGRWFTPNTRARVLNQEPFRGQGGTLYVRLANWRLAAGISEANNAPLIVREPLIIRRHVGNVTSRDYCDFSIRGYRFHAAIDQGQIDIERAGDPSLVADNEWDWFIESGFYDGFPADVYQVLNFYPSDYTSDGQATDVVNRYVKIYDFTREFRARSWGWPSGSGGSVLFYSAGSQPECNPATDPLVTFIESLPLSTVNDWTPLNPLARYVAFAPADDTADYAIFEARG